MSTHEGQPFRFHPRLQMQQVQINIERNLNKLFSKVIAIDLLNHLSKSINMFIDAETVETNKP